MVVASHGSGFILRNPDAFLERYGVNPADVSTASAPASSTAEPYLFFKVAPADASLSATTVATLQRAVGTSHVMEGTNVTAESFYSSQGRIDDSFDDRNHHMVAAIRQHFPDGQTLEMETFQLLHLARCCVRPGGEIKATAAAIVVANRPTGSVIDGELLHRLESDGGRAILEAICHSA